MQNTRRITRAEQRTKREKGYVLAIMTLLMIPLFAMTGFAIDVGAWYYQASRLQRTADAAALAGVVYQPDLFKATAVAKQVAAANGFTDGVDGITVDVINVNNSRLTVQITDSDAARYVTQIVDDSPVKIVRQSTAEYVKPVPLGSPSAVYGNSPGAGAQPNFWASIGGPFLDYEGGDPYATKCLSKPPDSDPLGSLERGNSCTTTNPDYRPEGYRFAVDVPAWAVGRTLTVELYDAGNYEDPYASPTPPSADDFWEVNTSFQLFDADNTPLDNYDNPPLPIGVCGAGRNSNVNSALSGFRYIANEADPGTFHNKWYTLCQVTVNRAGIFPLEVRSSGWDSSYSLPLSGDGSNQFSVRGSLSGSVPSGQKNLSVYALGDMSVFTNPVVGSGTGYAEFFLSEIGNSASGKTLTLELFDPGDSTSSSGEFTLDVVAPAGSFPGSSGAVTSGSGTPGLIPLCKWGERGGTVGALTKCSPATKVAGQTSGVYNGRWLRVQVPMTGYSCSTDCWWRVVYRFSGGSPSDRTVWVARVSGDPVRVVN